jgi:hypothetical protein
MMDKEFMTGLAEHAKDSGGEVIRGKLTCDLELTLSWTTQEWEPGVPVTKFLDRCEKAFPLDLKEGQEIVAAHYSGHATGCEVLDFKIGRAWFTAQGYEADQILENLKIECKTTPNDGKI